MILHFLSRDVTYGPRNWLPNGMTAMAQTHAHPVIHLSAESESPAEGNHEACVGRVGFEPTTCRIMSPPL